MRYYIDKTEKFGFRIIFLLHSKTYFIFFAIQFPRRNLKQNTIDANKKLLA